MKIRIIFLFVLMFLFLSCSKKTIKNVTPETKEVPVSPEINWDYIVPYFGTYLPEPYLNNLKKSKSHVKASDEFSMEYEYSPNVIILDEKGVNCNFNFHEGVCLKILNNDVNSMLVEDFETKKVYKLENNQCIQIDDLKYIKINDSKEINDQVISSFLIDSLLPKKKLVNGSNSFYVDGDSIFYNDEQYTYGVSLVFVGHKYDHIGYKSYSSEKYIEILENQINIYNAFSPDNNYDLGWESDAEYELESSFNLSE